jgi:peptidoglycan/LPS O-acetylase OafA/YrhL
MKKIEYVDAIRGIAILGVILCHINSYGGSRLTISPFFEKVTGFGAKGVQLFFIASAFTLFMSYQNRVKIEKFPIKNFFIRRFFRIAPLFYLSILYYSYQNVLNSDYALTGSSNLSSLSVFSHFVFLHGWNPNWIDSIVPGEWSIGVEMSFYVLLPFIFSKVKNINNAFDYLILSLIFNIICQLGFKDSTWFLTDKIKDNYLFFFLPNQLPIFFFGILMYFNVFQHESFKKIHFSKYLILSIISLLQLYKSIQGIHILFGIIFLVFCILLSKYRFPIIVNPVINYIGKISFSLYLCHFAVIFWYNSFHISFGFSNVQLEFWIKYLIITSVSVVFSTLIYNFIEIPFQNVGKNIINKLEKE